MGWSQRKRRQVAELHRRAKRNLIRFLVGMGVLVCCLLLTVMGHEGSTTGPTLDSRFTYTYDAVGNRITASSNRQQVTSQETYTYDNLYQLMGVTSPQPHTYQYDPMGNRLQADGTVYTPTPLNQYATVGGTNLTYDLNGNLSNDGVRSYDYDFDNRLTRVTGPGLDVRYAHDPFGRLLERNANGTRTSYRYDGDQIIEERNAANQIVATYTYGPGIDEPLTMTRGGQTYYYFQDGLGSVTELTNAAGEVVESYTYDPYGQPTPAVSAVGNPYRFTGRWYDEATGLYHARARTYSPTLGRFLQRDPRPVEPNPYSYALNNPTTLVDLQGNLTIVPGPLPTNLQDPRGIRGPHLPTGQLPSPPLPPTGWAPPLPPPPGPDLLPEPSAGTEAGQKERTGKRGQALSPGVGQGSGVDMAKGTSPEGKRRRGSKKQDIAEIDDAAQQAGIDDPETRREFGRFVEESKKQEGRGDYSFQELRQKASEFLGRK
ncbi:MAG: hypothetical protein HY597_07405 [Candidatus Omnitrophica bacterium]|nr:hypothetical protein [Candidatus Omnitrophota bacterium]